MANPELAVVAPQPVTKTKLCVSNERCRALSLTEHLSTLHCGVLIPSTSLSSASCSIPSNKRVFQENCS